jgi:hypothetical protein
LQKLAPTVALVFEDSDETGGRQFAGITYRSRLRDGFENWAVFEQGAGETPLTGQASEPVDPDDPDLRAALELLGLESSSTDPQHRRPARRAARPAGPPAPPGRGSGRHKRERRTQ